jgi:bacteriocin-like protein
METNTDRILNEKELEKVTGGAYTTPPYRTANDIYAKKRDVTPRYIRINQFSLDGAGEVEHPSYDYYNRREVFKTDFYLNKFPFSPTTDDMK